MDIAVAAVAVVLDPLPPPPRRWRRADAGGGERTTTGGSDGRARPGEERVGWAMAARVEAIDATPAPPPSTAPIGGNPKERGADLGGTRAAR